MSMTRKRKLYDQDHLAVRLPFPIYVYHVFVFKGYFIFSLDVIVQCVLTRVTNVRKCRGRALKYEKKVHVGCHSDRFDFVFSLRCIDCVRKPLCEPKFLCIFCITNYIGTQSEVCTVKGL